MEFKVDAIYELRKCTSFKPAHRVKERYAFYTIRGLDVMAVKDKSASP